MDVILNNKKACQKQFEEQITRYVQENVVTIINSVDSGNIPVHLAKAGYKVIVAASEKKLNGYSRVKNAIKEYDYPNAEKLITYNNVSAMYDKNYHIIFMSYSNKVINEIMQHNKDSNFAVIIEGPYNNINAQVLIAFCKKLIEAGSKFKLVIINNFSFFNAKLSNLFNGANIIESPIKSENVITLYKPFKYINEILVNLLLDDSQHNFLILLAHPNKIKKFHYTIKNTLEKLQMDVEIFILQSSAYLSEISNNSLKKRIILAADITQVRCLPIDIDVVIDCGIEKNIKVIDGIQTSFLQYISLQTIEEHKALAGIYSPGTYWLCSNKNYSCRKMLHTEVDSSLDNMLLELFNYNIHISSCDLLLLKSMYYIDSSISLLKMFGAIDNNLKVTDLGKDMCKIPINIRFARMLVEAKKYNVEFDVLLFYILCNFNPPHYIIKNGVSTPTNTNLIELINLFKKAYFKIDTSIFDKDSSKKLSSYIATIKNISTSFNITPRYYTNVVALKKVIPYGFPDSLYVLSDTYSYINSDTSLPSYISRPSETYNLDKYIVALASNFVDKTISIPVRKKFLSLYVSYTLDEVLEYFSPFLSKVNFTDDTGSKIKYIYNNLEIVSVPM